MNPEQEDFQQLQRLLVLKRYEQPPPGYFERLPRQIIARLGAEEQAPDSFLDRVYSQTPWLRRLWMAFEAKPVLAGAFAMAVSGLLIAGVIFSDQPEGNGSFALVPSPAEQHLGAPGASATPGSLFGQSVTAQSSSMQGVLGAPNANSLFKATPQLIRFDPN